MADSGHLCFLLQHFRQPDIWEQFFLADLAQSLVAETTVPAYACAFS